MLVLPGLKFNVFIYTPQQLTFLALGGQLLLLGLILLALKRREIRLAPGLLTWLMAGFCGWVALSALNAPTIAWTIWACLRWILFPLFFCLTVALVRNENNVQQIGLVIGLSTGLMAAVGLAQVFGLDMYFPQAAVPASTMGNKNVSAELIAACTPLILHQLTITSLRRRCIMGLCLGLCLAYLWFARSTTSLLALLIGLAVVFAAYRRTLFAWVVVLVLLVLISAPFIIVADLDKPIQQANSLKKTLTRIPFLDKQTSAIMRLQTWRDAGKLWLEKPILGQGPGHFFYSLCRVFKPSKHKKDGSVTRFNKLRREHFQAHNDFLNFLSEIGLGGLIVLSIFLFSFINLLRLCSTSPGPWLAGSLVGWFVCGLLSIPFAVAPSIASMGLICGLSAALSGSGKTTTPRRLSLFLAAVLIAVITTATILVFSQQWISDYHYYSTTSMTGPDKPGRIAAALDKAEAINIWNINVPLSAAIFYQKHNNPVKAVALYRKTLTLAPCTPTALHNLALILFTQGLLNQAAESAMQASAVDPHKN